MILKKQPRFQLEDDRSISSTLTVESPLKNLLTGVESPQKTRRAVSFDLDSNKEYATVMLFEELSALWFTYQDFRSFSNKRRLSVHAIRLEVAQQKQPLSYEGVLTRTYMACCDAPFDTTRLMSSLDSLLLVQYSNAKLLGLDRSILKALSQHRSIRRKDHTQSVLRAQKKVGFDAELIGAIAADISLASRLFARTIAQAVAGGVDQESLRLISV
jgi:hypothetical protein